MEQLYLILIIVAVLFVTLAAILKRYRRCPSDKILVIYGKTGRNATGSISSARCIHGGAAFIWPVFQDYAFLDLKPISIECNLTNALSKQNIRVDVPCRFTVGISTEPEVMTNAAERLLGLSIDSIQNIATDILFGQLRLVTQPISSSVSSVWSSRPWTSRKSTPTVTSSSPPSARTWKRNSARSV